MRLEGARRAQTRTVDAFYYYDARILKFNSCSSAFDLVERESVTFEL